MPIANPSFESAGAALGEADSWEFAIVATAEEIAPFDSTVIEATEDFEEEWAGNENYDFGFDDAVFELAAYDAVEEAIEDFEEGWSDNDNFISGLTDGVNALRATYGGHAAEDFEEEWSSNENYLFDFSTAFLNVAAYDGAALEPVEDFEEIWRGNESFATTFAALSSQAADYDTVTESFEDFEDEWPNLTMTTI